MIINTIAFLGGDKRQLFCAKALFDKGYNVLLAGFDLLESYGDLKLVELNADLEKADVFILPLTGVKGDIIPCYFSDKEIKIDRKLRKTLNEKPVFMGRADSLKGVEAFDLLKREDFAVKNAVPTAEGALCVAIKSYEKTIAGSDILVIGFGRIGKILSYKLKSLNAEVTVATRSCEKSAYADALGLAVLNTDELRSLDGFDIVFNTADAVVIDKDILKNSESDVLIIDLASYPGGVDFATAGSLGFTAFTASALPGQFSPMSAGEIIADTVLTIIGEEKSQ